MANQPLTHWLRHVRHLAGAGPQTERTDRQPLQRFTAYHDEDTFELLVRRHGAMVFGVRRRLLSDSHDAEERQRWSPSADRLCFLRALHLLEYAEGEGVRRLLEELAAGMPGALLTEQAKAILERRKHRIAKRHWLKTLRRSVEAAVDADC